MVSISPDQAEQNNNGHNGQNDDQKCFEYSHVWWILSKDERNSGDLQLGLMSSDEWPADPSRWISGMVFSLRCPNPPVAGKSTSP